MLLLTVAPAAHAVTYYVASNGEDSTFCGFQVIGGFTCGAKATPCRSIQCAVREADPGDTVIVGPGRYGDLNRDGDLTDDGEESGSSGCGCMVSVNKAITVVSSEGAAATVIDARSVDVERNVLLVFNGGEFGQPGKGFTVTSSLRNQSRGIRIDGANVKVRGNQVVSTQAFPVTTLTHPYSGIEAVSGGRLRPRRGTHHDRDAVRDQAVQGESADQAVTGDPAGRL